MTLFYLSRIYSIKKISILVFLLTLFLVTLNLRTAVAHEVLTTNLALRPNLDLVKDYHIDESVQAATFLKRALNENAQGQNVYHVFSHGKPGQLLLNGKWSNAKEIATFLRQNMTPNTKEIYLYGCNFARGNIGKDAIAYLEQSLNINIAASNNITGQNGDWILENNSVDMTAVFVGYKHSLKESTGFFNWLKSWFVEPSVETSEANASAFLACTPVPGQIDIEGTVYKDLDDDGTLDVGETGDADIAVDIYEDVNSDGLVDAGDVQIGTVNTDATGFYSYTFPPSTGSITDDFSSGNFSGGSGWTAAWVTTGAPEVSGGEARLEDGESIYRMNDFSSIVSATISLDYREASTLEFDDQLIIEICSDATFGNCQVLVDVTDDFTNGSINNVAIDADKLTATTSLRMRLINYEAGAFFEQPEYAYFDNVVIDYTNPSSGDFVIEVNTSSLGIDYSFTTDNVETAVFTALGEKDCDNNFGYKLADSDGDGVDNINDLDDDNDGILDIDEGFCVELPTTLGSIVVNTQSGEIAEYDIETEASNTICTGLGSTVFDIAMKGDGSLYYILYSDGSISSVDPSNCNLANLGDVGAGTYNSLSILPDGTLLAGSSSASTGVKRFDPVTMTTTDWADSGDGIGASLGDFCFLDGFIYYASSSGLQRITVNANYDFVSIATVGSLTGTAYGMTLTANCQLVYGGNNELRVIDDPSTSSASTLITSSLPDFGNVYGLTSVFEQTGCSTSCTNLDTDLDGIPDYLDLDSDGDGCADALEGAGSFALTDLVDASGTDLDGGNTGTGYTGTAGPFIENLGTNSEQTDPALLGVPIVSPATTAVTQGVGESIDGTPGAGCPCLNDADGDLVCDEDDLDDDNDGILDTDECPTTSLLFDVGWNSNKTLFKSQDGVWEDPSDGTSTYATLKYWEDGNDGVDLTMINGQGDPYVINSGLTDLGDGANVGSPYSTAQEIGDVESDLSLAMADGDYIEYPFQTASFASAGINNLGTVSWNGYNFSMYAEIYETAAGAGTATELLPEVLIRDGNLVLNTVFGNSYEYYALPVNYYAVSPNTDYTVRVYYFNPVNSPSPTTLIIDDFQIGFVSCDTDGDGVPNFVDLDSDNDGCPDFVEGGGTFIPANGTTASGTVSGGTGSTVNTNFGTDVGTNGVPTAAGTGQAVGSSNLSGTLSASCDSDGDGVQDSADIDSDNDGIPDDVENATAGAAGDTDGDGIPDYLDLDSDNDGIPDLVEAGGTDTNGDGVLDDACNVSATCDVDGDGLMDSVDEVDDTSNPSPTIGVAGTLLPIADTDSDGQPDFQDLDADNDGINDIAEAGITDTDNNGIVDQVNPDGTLSADADSDGFSDSLDPGEGGTPGITTDPDADADGQPDDDDGDGTAYNADDTDSDGTPDFQDLDSDNDGIHDVIEGGNGTHDTDGDGTIDADDTGYADTDNDGIPDSIDETPSTYGNGDSGAPNAAPTNTDSDNIPDYQDLDADNDSINDVIEGGNSDVDGDGQVDNPTTDTDGDGIPDAVDEAVGFGDAENDTNDDPTDSDNDGTPDAQEIDSDNDGTNDIDDPDNPGGDPTADSNNDGVVDTATDTDGDGIADVVDGYPGFGDLPSTCGSGTIEYAITDGTQSTTGWQWNDAALPAGDEPSNQTYGLHRSTAYCESGGWRNYYNSNEPDKFLFSVEMGSNTTEIDYVEIRVDATPESRYDTTATGAIFGMARDWHVKTVGDAALTAPVNIRFYYVPSELQAILDGAVNLSEIDPSSTAPTPADIVWFKKDTYDPANDINPDGTVLTNGAGYTVLPPQVVANANGESERDNSAFGNGVNYVQFNGITGFSGGSAFVNISGAALPIELLHFNAMTRGCSADLIWATESTENFSHFEVEWSKDGRSFMKVASLEGEEYSQSILHYSYSHKSEVSTNYYRLKMVDLDGTYEYSKLVFAEINCYQSSLAIYPNPVSKNGVIDVRFIVPVEESFFEITDVLGHTVKRIPFRAEPNVLNTVRIGIADLPSGTYMLRLLGSTTDSKLFIISE